jgi:hypothetical protein
MDSLEENYVTQTTGFTAIPVTTDNQSTHFNVPPREK